LICLVAGVADKFQADTRPDALVYQWVEKIAGKEQKMATQNKNTGPMRCAREYAAAGLRHNRTDMLTIIVCKLEYVICQTFYVPASAE
jgi:hypothetical protein